MSFQLSRALILFVGISLLSGCGFFTGHLNGGAKVPVAQITSAPSISSLATSASIAFQAVAPGAAVSSYHCQMDAGAFQVCTSPFATSDLLAGAHTFQVYAVTSSGTVSNTASTNWTILSFAWKVLGQPNVSVGTTSVAKFASDRAGNFYVAYTEVTLSQKITVMKWNGSVWSVLGARGFSSVSPQYVSFAVSRDGIPTVAFSDAVNSGKLTVMTFDGTSWSTLGGAGVSAAGAWYVSLALDSVGKPYVFYRDQGNGTRGTVLAWSGTTWSAVGGTGFTSHPIQASSIALDSLDHPYVVYADNSVGDFTTAQHWNGTTWSTVGAIGFSGAFTDQVSILVDSTSAPYVLFQVGYPVVHAGVMRWNGTSWNSLDASTLNGLSISSSAIALDSKDRLSLVVSDQLQQGRGSVYQYTGSTWSLMGGSSASERSVTTVGLAVGSDNALTVMGLDAFTQRISVLNFNPTAAASSLNWMQSSPQGVGSITARWTLSESAFVSAQAIQYYGDAFCGIEQGVPQTLPAATTSSSVVTTAGNFTSFRILTTLATGLQSWSNCSTELGTTSIWSYAGGLAGAQSPQLAHAMAGDSMGRPCEVFNDGRVNNALSVACWNGTQWGYVGSAGFTANAVVGGPLAIAFDSTNRPYVAFVDASLGGNTNTVMRWNGTAWVTVGSAGAAGGSGTSPSLAVNSASNVFVAYSDSLVGAKLTVMSYNGSTWSALGGADFSPGAATGVALALDSVGLPWVAYQDSANSGFATVQRWNGSAWNVVGSAGFSGGTDLANSLVLDSSDQPALAFSAFGTASVWRFNGSSWAQLGGAVTTVGGIGIKLVRDASNVLTVGYAEQISASSPVTVKQWDGTSWNTVGSADFSIGGTTQVDLAVSPAGRLYAGYVDSSVNNLFFLRRFDP